MPVRHGALRETVSWGYERLSPAAARLFRLLAVCRAGADLELARRIAGETRPNGGSTLAALEMLVRHGLVVLRPGNNESARFQMLETVREFSLQALEAEEGREPALVALASAIGDLVREAEQHLARPARTAGASAWRASARTFASC